MARLATAAWLHAARARGWAGAQARGGAGNLPLNAPRPSLPGSAHARGLPCGTEGLTRRTAWRATCPRCAACASPASQLRAGRQAYGTRLVQAHSQQAGGQQAGGGHAHTAARPASPPAVRHPKAPAAAPPPARRTRHRLVLARRLLGLVARLVANVLAQPLHLPAQQVVCRAAGAAAGREGGHGGRGWVVRRRAQAGGGAGGIQKRAGAAWWAGGSGMQGSGPLAA